jgi:type I restriction enzyme M protein
MGKQHESPPEIQHLMSAEANRIVQKLWSYCTVLRDDGLSYGDYLEQLSVLLFLKLAHEQTQPPWNQESPVPEGYDWSTLVGKDGVELETQYRRILEHLGKQHGLLGLVFRKAQNKIQDPAKLKRLIVDLIDKENWSATGVDIKGDAYEGLLAKGAEDIKSGAGQYFTPRALIAAMVDVIQPTAKDEVHDPACGTGGFLLAAYEYAASQKNLSPTDRRHLRDGFVSGIELVDSTARLAAMNMLLHGMGTPNGASPIEVRDGLTADPGKRYSVVLANPPFGTKSSVT